MLGIIVACNVCIEIGMGLITLSMIEDINSQLRSMNESAHSKGNKIWVLKSFSKLIQFHVDVKQLNTLNFKSKSQKSKKKEFYSRTVGDISEAYAPIFIALLLWSIAAIGGAMLIIMTMEMVCHLIR